MTLLDDPVLRRLEAADPAAGLDEAAPDHAALRRALATRHRRRRVGALVPVPLAGAGAAVVLLGPSSSPAVAQIVDRALDASTPPAGSIVASRSTVEGRYWGAKQGRSSSESEERGWVRIAADGEVTDVRTIQLRHAASDEPTRTTPVETATSRSEGGEPVLRTYDGATGRTKVDRGAWEVPRETFQARDLLRAARDGRTDVRLDGEETRAGRRTYRLLLTGEGRGLPQRLHLRTTLYVDAATYAPVELRSLTWGRDVQDEPFRTEVVQRVLEHEVLPDDAAHRRLLELRGPTRP
jgi:hypothetical protein